MNLPGRRPQRLPSLSHAPRSVSSLAILLASFHPSPPRHCKFLVGMACVSQPFEASALNKGPGACACLEFVGFRVYCDPQPQTWGGGNPNNPGTLYTHRSPLHWKNTWLRGCEHRDTKRGEESGSRFVLGGWGWSMGTSVPKDQGKPRLVWQPQSQSGLSQRLCVNSSFKDVMGGHITGWQVSREGSRDPHDKCHTCK